MREAVHTNIIAKKLDRRTRPADHKQVIRLLPRADITVTEKGYHPEVDFRLGGQVRYRAQERRHAASVSGLSRTKQHNQF